MAKPLNLDQFGIGAAQFMALDLFENSSRLSGRSEALVSRVSPGDAIVVPTSEVARIYVSDLQNAGMSPVLGFGLHSRNTVAVLVISPTRDHRAVRGTNPHGHSYLSHDFIYEVYQHALRLAASRLNTIEEDLSKMPRPQRDIHRHRRGAMMNEIAYSRHPL